MRRSKAEIYLHMVWATWRRQQVLVPDVERAVHHCIQQECQRLGCAVLAIGGMPDHVHLVVQIPTVLSIAKLAQQVKGVSSTFVRDQLDIGEPFRWQDNYAVFSISRSHLKRVITYVKTQKEHHASNNFWPEWEETDEPAPNIYPESVISTETI